MAESYSLQQAYELAIGYFQRGRYAEAEQIFRPLAAIVSRHESFSYYFGLTCCILGKTAEGADWLRKTLDINPEHVIAHFNLGVVLNKLGHPDEAMASLHNAMRNNPDSLIGLDLIKYSATTWRETLRNLEHITAQSIESGDCLRAASCFIISLISHEIVAVPEILEVMRMGIWSRPAIFQRCLPFLQDDIHEMARDDLINNFNRQIAKIQLDGWGCLYLALLWRHLVDLGWYSSHAQCDPVCKPEHVAKLVLFAKNIQVIGSLLRYRLDSPRDWNERLFRNYILPLIERSGQMGCDWVLFPLDVLNGFVFCQQPHTEKQARYCFAELSPGYVSKGIRLGQTRARLQITFWDPPTVVFYSSCAINLSPPFQVIRQILLGWHFSDHKSFIPLIIGFSGIDTGIKEFLQSYSIEFVDIDNIRGKQTRPDVLDERLNALYEILKQRRVSALVDFGSLDGFSSLVAASRIAPVQVYFSVGYHYMDGPGWDAFFCVGFTGETNRTYDGRIWRTVTVSHQDPRALPSASEHVNTGREIRAKRFSSQSVVLGVIARPQKLNNEEFLTALAKILTRNSNAVFLWFGDKERESVRQRMIALGISGQCLFEGYQNTSVYAQVLDIHLDPFPFPSGLSIRDTMCYGVPSVSMITRDAQRAGVVSQILPMLRRECGTEEQQETMRGIFTDSDTGESLALLANSMEEYVALTQKLIDDPVFRKKVGRAGQRFLETFLLDPKICYESFSRQILEVIEGKKEMMQREGLA